MDNFNGIVPRGTIFLENNISNMKQWVSLKY